MVDFTKTLTRLDCFDFSVAALILSYEKLGKQSGASKSMRFSHRPQVQISDPSLQLARADSAMNIFLEETLFQILRIIFMHTGCSPCLELHEQTLQ